MLLKHNYKKGKILYTERPKKCITHVCMNTCMESTPTHNLWFWPKRPPLVFSVAEMSVAEMSVAEMSAAEMSYIPLMGTQTFFIRFRPNFIYRLLSNSHPSWNMGFVCGTIIKMAIKISATCQFALVDTQT